MNNSRHVRHDDGDEEDMVLEEFEKARENYLKNVVPHNVSSFTTSPTTTTSDKQESEIASNYIEIDTWEVRSILPDFAGIVPSQGNTEERGRSRRRGSNKPMHPYDALHDRELNIDGTPLNLKSKVIHMIT